MMRPWRFWSELQMFHPVRWGRITLVLLALLLALYAVFALSAAVGAYRVVSVQAARGAKIEQPAWLAAVRCAIVPWQRYQAPSATTSASYRYEFRMPMAGWRAVRFGTREQWLPPDDEAVIPERAFAICLSIVLAPVGFILLPLSRRVAKVRWRHILRIGLYSVALTMLPIGIDCYAQVAGVPRRAIGEITLAMTLLAAMALLTWWACATSRYLRIAHGWGVGAFVVGFAYLAQRGLLEALDLVRVLW